MFEILLFVINRKVISLFILNTHTKDWLMYITPTRHNMAHVQ